MSDRPKDHPIGLSYEQPDEDRAAVGLSPVGQAVSGVVAYFTLLITAALIHHFKHAPILAILNSLALGIGASLWAHFRLRWYEFAPAMAVCFALSLAVIPFLWLVTWIW